MSITRKPPANHAATEERPELFNHLNLPCTDDKPVDNYYQPLQAWLLSGSIGPHCEQLFPNGDFSMGSNSGIYWKLTKKRLDGCKAPDWFFVPNVPKMLGGELRRSYVLWQEHQHPLIVAELVSGNGREEHDITPNKGKFWVYERAIQAEYYVIYDVARKGLEVYRLVNGRYQRLEANAAGRVPIIPLQLELGIWQGTYQKTTTFWLRAWDAKGNLLLIGEEVAAAAKQQLEAEKQRADKLAAKLRELGIAPDSL